MPQADKTSPVTQTKLNLDHFCESNLPWAISCSCLWKQDYKLMVFSKTAKVDMKQPLINSLVCEKIQHSQFFVNQALMGNQTLSA